ncbi:hypothetical protein Tco_0209811 [Tanacetum coccineum]
MEIEVAKCSINKKYLKIEKKELSLDNDLLLEHIICQDVMNVVMHADYSDNVLLANNNSLEHDNSALELYMDEYEENLKLHIELAKKSDMIEKSEHARELRPFDSDLSSTCSFVTRIQELLVYISATCPSTKHVSDKLFVVTPMNKTRKVSSTDASGSKPRSNTKNNRIPQTSLYNENVKHYVLNANSKLVYATCHEYMFNDIHDLCVRDYLVDVNACV